MSKLEPISNLLRVEDVCVQRIELSVFVARNVSLQSIKSASADFAGQTETKTKIKC